MRLQVDLDNRQFLSKTPTRQTAFLQQRFAGKDNVLLLIMRSFHVNGLFYTRVT